MNSPTLLQPVTYQNAGLKVQQQSHELQKLLTVKQLPLTLKNSTEKKKNFKYNKTKCTLFFYKNTYNLAEPEDVLILAYTFS